MKVVRKEYFKQDPKVRENLEREIRILKLLRACESVVQLYHVQVSSPACCCTCRDNCGCGLGAASVYRAGNGAM